MRPLIIANWKMNLTLSDAVTIAQEIEDSSFSSRFLLAPPTPYLAYFAQAFKNFSICAQDISVLGNFGAFTGENSADIVKSCGVNYSIVGHSERRRTFFETNKTVNQKVQNCIKAGITPIICIGETLETRKNNTFKEFIIEQVKSIPETEENIIIAYEPVWAIGSKVLPLAAEIEEVINLIKYNTPELSIVAKNASLVYGGSVNSKNYENIIKIPGIDGVLIGSASLNKEEIKLILS